MCTLLLAYEVHPRYHLVLAANRDEDYHRPTAVADFWEDAPRLFAGRDLVHGGTWLGITKTGRIAALTNYREPQPSTHGPSRGNLVSRFLNEETGAEDYVERLRREGPYRGYNLVMGDRDGLYHYSNKSDLLVRLAPGIHGLSNNLLNTPWPKVVQGKASLARVLAAENFSTEDLFVILADSKQAPDEQLPDTGVGLDLERLLSPIFIKSERYGTRSSTVLLVNTDGKATFVERSFDGRGARDTQVVFEWFPRKTKDR